MKKRTHKNGKKKPNHRNGPIVKLEPSFPTLPERIEQALINGDLKNLDPEERIQLYMQTCKSLKLNPMTKPFGYILMKDWGGDGEKLILYATRNCTDQLRSVYGAGDVPNSLKREQTDNELIAEIAVVGRNGRISHDVGVIPLQQYTSKGSFRLTDKGKERQLANAKMHVVTKARRRATLALYGLGGIVDESELDTMQVVGGLTKEGRIWRYVNQPQPERELIEYGDYPRGPKSDLAAASLARVEAADKEFVREVAAPRAAPPGAPASKPEQGTPAERGRVGESPRASAQGVKTTGGPTPRPPVANNDPKVEGLLNSAKKLIDKNLATPGGVKQPSSSLNRFNEHPTEKSRVPQARIPHRIEEVKGTPNGKGLEVVLDTGHRMFTFDNHKMDEKGTRLHDILRASVGKMIICTTKMEKNWMHIDRVFQLGDREWDDEGVPVLRREPATKRTREPGEEG